MLQGEDSFDNTANARAALRVTNIGLHRTNVHALVAEDVSHGPCLDGVTYCRSGSMALVNKKRSQHRLLDLRGHGRPYLHKGSVSGVKSSLLIDCPHEGRMSLSARAHKSLTAAITVRTRAANHGTDRVAVAQGITETLDVDGGDSLGSRKAICCSVKCLARCIWR